MAAVTTLIVLALVAVSALYLWATYNDLVLKRNRVLEAWSGIEVQMKRRYDLVPNLVETVRGYAKHEAETLQNVTEARERAVATTGAPHLQAPAEAALGGALRGLLAVVENYPDLKANENFLSLQADLAEIEEAIEGARRYYNGATRDLNVKIEQFPSNLVAKGFGFEQADFFDLGEQRAAASQPVAVKF